MRYRALLTASLALIVFVVAATAASATTMKLVTGATLASNSSISGGLKAGTSFVLSGGSAGNITCTGSTFGGWFGTNPNTPSVTGGLSSWTFSGCTDTIPFVTVSSTTTNVGTGANAKTLTATYVGAASTLAVHGLVWTVTFTDGRTCVYAPTTDPARAQHNSLTSPWNNEYAFAAVSFTKTGGTSFACPLYPSWSATFVITSGGVGVTIQP